MNQVVLFATDDVGDRYIIHLWEFGDFSKTARTILTKLCICLLMTIGHSAIPNFWPRYPWGVRDMAPKRVNLTSFFALFRVFHKNCPYDFAETHSIASPGQYLSAGTKFMRVALLGGWEFSLKNRIFLPYDDFWTLVQFSRGPLILPNAVNSCRSRLSSSPDPHARLCFD